MKTFLIIVAAVPLMLGAAAHSQPVPKPIPRADYIKLVDSHYSTLDANHDGVVTRAELAAEQQRELSQAKARIAQDMLSRFKQLDTNKDGQLSFQEFAVIAPPVRTTENPDQMFTRLDTNHDGKVTADEYRAPELAKFSRVDTNHDGIVTPAEVQAANKK